MRMAYPHGKHKNQLQGYLSTIYGDCQIVRYEILYKICDIYKMNLAIVAVLLF